MTEHYILSDGFKIPKVGFGTAGFKGKDGARRIEMALNNGFRLIDSAFNYENEGAVGYAVRNSGVPRDQITVTSKLPGRHHEYDAAMKTIDETVFSKGLVYIDLYMFYCHNTSNWYYMY